jgi:hypothetical protein
MVKLRILALVAMLTIALGVMGFRKERRAKAWVM